ncbi:tyrosine-type recombinase/integrase [Maricaulis maris]|uniref:tyrosine-type recombinase/integrase n=1 Tax=Maricaulis maris TaxID=74318 RepID=UPI002920A80F|nr:hypothetical protein MACH15_01650 [Maricaulis maris]
MAKPTQIPFLTERNGTLIFRRRVPLRFRDCAGLYEWKKALGRESERSPRIRLELRLLTEATDEALSKLERGLPVRPDLLDEALKALYPAQAQSAIQTLDHAVAAYLSVRGLPELRKAEAVAVEQFCALFPKRRVFDITRSDVRRWVDHLRTTRRQTGPTIRRRLGSMRAIFAVAAEETNYNSVNPFRSVRIPDGADGGVRLPFERAHLAAIDAWLKGQAGQRATGRIIRLMRLTGARPLEIGGLDASDLNLDGDVPTIYIRPNSSRGLKTRNSQRILPLVGDALVAAQELKAAGSIGPLFPASCHQTGALSARLNKALRSAGVPACREYTAYSFRHTMEETLRFTDAPFEVQQAVLGHAPKTMTDRYGAKRVPLTRIHTSLLVAAALISTQDKTK